MAESPSPASAAEASDYWCYHCNKRVPVKTLENAPDVVCQECKNGFVESIQSLPTPISTPPSLSHSLDESDDPSFGPQFLQFLRLIAQTAREEDVPPPPPLPEDHQPGDDFLRIELGGWDNDEDDAAAENEENEDGVEVEEDRFDNENEGDEEDQRRRRREVLRLRIRDLSDRARTGRNRILDWAEILMGLEDNSIELRFEVSESDRYVGNPEDYVDADGYEQLLQNLADSDSGRRGAPPAAKAAISALPSVKILSDQEAVACAICKDVVGAGDMVTKLPCGHAYHGDCIISWLGSRNSCPVCRFELPTDDPEYEEERRKGTNASAGGASASASFAGNSGPT